MNLQGIMHMYPQSVNVGCIHVAQTEDILVGVCISCIYACILYVPRYVLINMRQVAYLR